MGFFMRNFERQADLYSATTMGTPKAIISSLEKIAHLSGKSRNLPSWHHFSIKERVDCLRRNLEEPDLVKRHNRFIAASFLTYLVCLVGLVYVLNFSPIKQHIIYSLGEKALSQQLLKDPVDIDLWQNLAMIYHETKEYEKAIGTYERIIDLDPNHATVLNNLAWLLATVPDQGLRDKMRALDLAKKAVAIERSAMFLDTLAEAYYVNGMISEAVEAIEEAVSIASEGRNYYEKQLKKFLASGG
jgi:tetratricopeptide (TPR) repeat protein